MSSDTSSLTRYLVLTLMLTLMPMLTPTLSAKTIEETHYRRSSIYSILVNHTEQPWAPYIANVFCQSPVPDKYNDHDLSVKVLTTSNKTAQKGEDFLVSNHVAAHLVARWFERNPETGVCSLDLVKSRGLYSASEMDKLIAAQTVRGNALLEDAGEQLIGNTFVIVNDISYYDKAQTGQAVGTGLNILATLAGALVGGSTGQLLSDAGDLMQVTMETLKGFKVKVHTYLYRLRWDEETAAVFYTTMYAEQPDTAKVAEFNNHMDLFQLDYVGEQFSDGEDVSFMGVNLDTPDQMIQKACVRAIDHNVANLARNFEPFKVKVSLTNETPIQAPIGKKEEISAKTKFEVLETIERADGTRDYRQVAVIQPVEGMIWDNRFMASEEGAEGADLGVTTFRKLSGGKIYRGMLIRELQTN